MLANEKAFGALVATASSIPGTVTVATITIRCHDKSLELWYMF
jgi:hypothetical protein